MDLGEGISAVLPAYNEEAVLGGTISGLHEVLAGLGRPFEIIVVNDGSVDATGALIDRVARANAAVRAVHHSRNLGYGDALKSGFAAARLEWVFLMDADGQFDPSELSSFVDAVGPADFVVGYRSARADPTYRTLYARVWAAMMSVLLGVGVRDVDCAFKLMRRSHLCRMNLEAGGAFLSAEMLAKARRMGARFAELPVRHLPRRAGSSSGGSLRVMARAFVELARVGWKTRRFRPMG